MTDRPASENSEPTRPSARRSRMRPIAAVAPTNDLEHLELCIRALAAAVRVELG